MAKKTNKFHFLYPVSEWDTTPASFVGNLLIYCAANLDSDDDYIDSDIDEIIWNESNVTTLVKAISPDEYDDIKRAAEAKGEYIFSLPKPESEDYKEMFEYDNHD